MMEQQEEAGNAPDARLGAWIVSLGNAVSQGDAIARDDLEAVLFASRAALFFSAIRGLSSVDSARLDVYRRDSGIKRMELPSVLAALKTYGFADFGPDQDGNLTVITAKTAGIKEVYDFASIVFKSCEPSACSLISVGILDATAGLPMRYNTLIQQISSSFHFDERTIILALKHLEAVGAIQITNETDRGERVVCNPQQHASSSRESLQALASLTGNQREQVLEIVQHVKDHPGVPIPAPLRGVPYSVLKTIGIIEAANYSPRHTEAAHEFPTLKTTWGDITFKNGTAGNSDIVHDAKALLASIRYGEHFASTSGGRIWSPYALLRALVNRGSVGPATNIGTDYPLIAQRGIINIVENPRNPGRYSMELVKKDVVEPVLELFREEVRAERDNDLGEFESGQYSFKPPEETRLQKLTSDIIDLRDEIIFHQLLYRR